MTDTRTALAWKRLRGLIEAHAPRLAQDLRPGLGAADIARFDVALPPALGTLYGLCDGQAMGHPESVFPGAYFLPLYGEESIASEREMFPTPWLPISKDFGGFGHGLALADNDLGPRGSVVWFADDPEVVAPSLGEALERWADEIASGDRTLDDRIQHSHTFEFVLREVTPGQEITLAGTPVRLVVHDPRTLQVVDTGFSDAGLPPADRVALIEVAPTEVEVRGLALLDAAGLDLATETGSRPVRQGGRMFTGHYAMADAPLPGGVRYRLVLNFRA
jgi:cell wall assembly regulator SMI1